MNPDQAKVILEHALQGDAVGQVAAIHALETIASSSTKFAVLVRSRRRPEWHERGELYATINEARNMAELYRDLEGVETKLTSQLVGPAEEVV